MPVTWPAVPCWHPCESHSPITVSQRMIPLILLEIIKKGSPAHVCMPPFNFASSLAKT